METMGTMEAMQTFKRIPTHIGIIPDGNRRWAHAQGYEKKDGYAHGVIPGFDLYEMMLEYGIKEAEKTPICLLLATQFHPLFRKSWNAMPISACILAAGSSISTFW